MQQCYENFHCLGLDEVVCWALTERHVERVEDEGGAQWLAIAQHDGQTASCR